MWETILRERESISVIIMFVMLGCMMVMPFLIIAKRLFGFAEHIDIGRICAGLLFLGFGLGTTLIAVLGAIAEGVPPDEQKYFLGSIAVLSIFVLIGIRILWLLRRRE